MLINTIFKLDENLKDKMWTELVRLLVLHSDERHDVELEGLSDYAYISDLFKRLGTLSPTSYTWSLSYKEKVDILMFLVDNIHDLDSFRQFLNKRSEDKS